jgi:hypothetical protein
MFSRIKPLCAGKKQQLSRESGGINSSQDRVGGGGEKQLSRQCAPAKTEKKDETALKTVYDCVALEKKRMKLL